MSRVLSGISVALIAGALVVANPSNVEARPNTREVEATRADKQRAAQLRHARERRDAARRIQPQSARSGSYRRPVAWPVLVTEARKYIGTNPTAMQRRWCARFLNLVLNKTGYRGTGSDAARSFASYGRRIHEPRIGADCRAFAAARTETWVMSASSPVSIQPVIPSSFPAITGAASPNSTYPRRRVIAYVMPADGPPMTQIAAAPRRVADQRRFERPSGANCRIARRDQFRGLGTPRGQRAATAPCGAAADRAVGCPNPPARAATDSDPGREAGGVRASKASPGRDRAAVEARALSDGAAAAVPGSDARAAPSDPPLEQIETAGTVAGRFDSVALGDRAAS